MAGSSRYRYRPVSTSRVSSSQVRWRPWKPPTCCRGTPAAEKSIKAASRRLNNPLRPPTGRELRDLLPDQITRLPEAVSAAGVEQVPDGVRAARPGSPAWSWCQLIAVTRARCVDTAAECSARTVRASTAWPAGDVGQRRCTSPRTGPSRIGSGAHAIMRQTGHASPVMPEVYAREHSPLVGNAVPSIGL